MANGGESYTLQGLHRRNGSRNVARFIDQHLAAPTTPAIVILWISVNGQVEQHRIGQYRTEFSQEKEVLPIEIEKRPSVKWFAARC